MEERRVETVASIARLETKVEMIESDMNQLKEDVRAIRSTLDSAGGSWKVLVVLGTLAAAAAATLGSIATWLSMAPR